MKNNVVAAADVIFLAGNHAASAYLKLSGDLTYCYEACRGSFFHWEGMYRWRGLGMYRMGRPREETHTSSNSKLGVFVRF